MTMQQLAERMNAIQPFHVMSLLARAKQLEAQGNSIIHMEIGEPDFPTPAPVATAGMRAIQAAKTQYTPACGLPALREKITAWYQQRFQVNIPAERIIITPGASGALQLVLGVLINPGNEILLTDPGYPCNRNFVRLFEGKAVEIPVSAAQNYQPTLEDIQSYWTEHTIAALLASPANPSGTVLSQPQIQSFHQAISQKNGALIIDEIYQELIYDQTAFTALNVADDIWIVNSFSKYFGMTGWRIGWLVAPEYALDALNRLAQNIFLSPSTPGQYAALAAFEAETLDITEQRRAEFAQRRNFLLPALQELGFSITAEPQGAFYIYAGSERFGEDSHQLSLTMLEQAGVAFTPGIDFGANQSRQHVRFAYTTSIEQLEQAIERLAKHLPR